MNWVEFRIIGVNPLPKQSFRASSLSGGYTDPRISAWQDNVSYAAKQAMTGKDKLSGYLAVEIYFVRKTKHRVDVDNLSKAILDAMNHIVYEDDNAILDATLHKRYGKTPGIYVYVHELTKLLTIDISTFTIGECHEAEYLPLSKLS